jgi:hypothetical protein
MSVLLHVEEETDCVEKPRSDRDVAASFVIAS